VPDHSSSRWSDLDRPSLDGASLQSALTRDSALWRTLEVVEEIGSTNAALAAAAGDDAPEGAVLVAEHQAAGRGRLDRVWTSPPRAGLTLSFLLRPDVPAARRGWLPLLTGVALAEAVGEVTGVRTSLKWPNDLLAVDGLKLAGILAESSTSPALPAAVVVGVGLNVNTTAAELPDTGTSLSRILGTTVDRGPLLLAVLRSVERRYRRWTHALGDPVSSGLAQDYLGWSSTVGSQVAVSLPDGTTLEGTAQAVDWDGRLVMATPAGTVELASGDVRHVRGTGSRGAGPGGSPTSD
jgi:BirA family biotin operon repressor/biotin-[acetyl-CoA-carboxylase] ligase